jgi:glutathione reductase (NADPH)
MHIELERGGTQLTMKATLTKLEKSGTSIRATLSTGETVDTDVVLYAVGRTPNTQGLGLERAGVKLDEAGAVIVDEFSQSCVESVYAIGDVTNRMNLTPVAIRDGHAFADTIYNQRAVPVDHSFVPSAVFGRPPIGTVGLSEADARRSFEAVDIFRTSFRPMRNMLTNNQERTLMKVVVDGKTGKLLGVHIAGEDAPEMVQLAAIAVKAGITKQQWDSTMALHPTAAEELVLLREKVVFTPSLA